MYLYKIQPCAQHECHAYTLLTHVGITARWFSNEVAVWTKFMYAPVSEVTWLVGLHTIRGIVLAVDADTLLCTRISIQGIAFAYSRIEFLVI